MGQPCTVLVTLVTIIIREMDVRSIFRAGVWDGNQNQILFILNLIKIVPDPRLLAAGPPTTHWSTLFWINFVKKCSQDPRSHLDVITAGVLLLVCVWAACLLRRLLAPPSIRHLHARSSLIAVRGVIGLTAPTPSPLHTTAVS